MRRLRRVRLSSCSPGGITLAQMPESPVLESTRAPRRRSGRKLSLILGAALAVVALSACTGPRDPTSYSDGVKKNFVEGCREGLSPTGVAATDPDAKAHESTCKCLITKLSAPADSGGVPFKEFADAQSKIRSEPTKYSISKVLPKYDEFVKACSARESGPALPSATS